MEIFFTIVLLVLFIALFGSIPGTSIAYGAVRHERRERGTVTDVLRDCGVGPALLALGIDAAKGAVCALLGYLMMGKYNDIGLGVFCAGVILMLWHSHSVLLGFKGSKGIAPYIGVLFFMDWRIGIVALVLGCVAFTVIKNYRIAALGSTAVAAIAVCIMQPKVFNIIFVWLMVAYVIWMQFPVLFKKGSKKRRVK